MNIDTTQWRSPNFNERASAILSIVVHSCEGVWPSPRVSSLPWLCNPASRVSCHYYVCRNTEIFQLVDDDNEAWHAGPALPRFDNASSIGVECEHRSGQNWPAEQKDALAWLLRRLIAAHRIPVAAIETHGQIAIKGPYKRKVDPTDWPHDDFVRWRARLVQQRYKVLGIPVYERSSRTGPLWGHLTTGEDIVIDDMSNGHLKDQRGFIRLDPDTLEAL
jgi:N-acetylmuramoyl-L-alanine amidase-like protein